MEAIRYRRYGPPEVLEFAEATRYLEAGHASGKIVITL
jgi:hypothetical protein